VGVHKGKSSEALPMRSPNKNKNKTHKAQMQGFFFQKKKKSGGKKKKKAPMLHLEARISLVEVQEATVHNCFIIFFC
jgi:hypothetical protein